MEKSNLTQRYSQLSDIELIELRNSGGLIEIAEAALAEEFDKRGLTPKRIEEVVSNEVYERKAWGQALQLAICVIYGNLHGT